MSKRFRRITLMLAIWLATSAFDCHFIFGTPPSVGTHDLDVPYQGQVAPYYCVEACIVMWHDYVLGSDSAVTQDELWNWGVAHVPAYMHLGVGTESPAAAAIASQFIHREIVDRYYFGDYLRRQAVADQAAGIHANNPTIAYVNNGAHAVVVTGVTWNRLSDALTRPDMEYMHVNDPANSSNTAFTVGYWTYTWTNLNYCGCAINIQVSQQNGVQTLAEFDAEGGRYIGPTPANPVGRYMLDGNGACYWESNDTGPDQCNVSGGGGGGGGTPTVFSDNPITAGVTVIKGIHVQQLRTAVNAQRVRFGVSNYSWTDPTLTAGATSVKVAHIAELRDALRGAYLAAGLTPPSYAEAIYGGYTPINGSQIMELRQLVNTLESH